MSELSGQKILQYKIIEQVGQGGMGVVYLAEDTKLKREVAIKFLPQLISADQEQKKRFELEAQAAASLNHPNITTIHAIEESSNDVFIVMEYIDGIELKEKIKAGPVPVEESIKIAIQIAEGLAAAHKKGIVHRDIKSQNIMITGEAKIKIMDFGLAKVGEGTQLTKVGSTIGTAAYMSPEQASGEEVDYRTDIWSFGVVLYEMITGRMPFKGDYEQAVIYSILNEKQPAPVKLNSDIPAYLNEIIETCLQKDPGLRYQNIKEVSENLKKAKSISKAKTDERELKKVAILPFTNIGGNPQSDYLGFALADQVIGSLSYLKEVLVRPSASIRKYINTMVNLKETGRDLNVDFLLSGNFLNVEDQIRLNVELVEIKTENLVWRDSINVKFKDAFELQDIVSQKIADGLRIQFSGNEKQRINKDIPNDPLAYEYYLKAVSCKVTKEQNELALNMLDKSLALDPNYAPSYVEMGRRYYYASNEFLGGIEFWQKAVEYYKKALELNDELIPALTWLGVVYTEKGEINKSIQLLRKSVNINSNNAMAHFGLSYAYRYAGALDEAKEEAERAVALDPGNPRFRSIGVTYYYLQEYNKAKEYLNYDSKSNFSIYWTGITELKLGNSEKAKEYLKMLSGRSLFSNFSDFFISYLDNDKNRVTNALQKLEEFVIIDGEDMFWIAVCHALNNDPEGCEKWMQKAIEGGFIIYDYMIKESFLDGVKNYPGIAKNFELAKKKHLEFKKKYFT